MAVGELWGEKPKRKRSRKRQAAGFFGSQAKRAAPRSKHNTNIVIAGIIFSAMVDIGYMLYKGPGYMTPSPFGPKIYWGDVGQLTIYLFLLMVGITQARGDLTSFGFGLAAGKTTTAILLPAIGAPRYLVFQYDVESGTIKKAWGS